LLPTRATSGVLSRAAVLVCLASFALPVSAQNATKSELEELAAIRAASGVDNPPPRFHFLRAFDTSLTTSSQHNSSGGWNSIFYPNLAWRLNPHFGVDVSVPAYIYLDTFPNISPTTKPVYVRQPEKGAWGDTVLNFEYDTPVHRSVYSGIFSLGLPSGNAHYGIGAAQVTYSFNNWLAKDMGRFTPNVALGYGNTSTLVNQGVLRDYVAVGPMAHFQAGTSFALTRSISFNAAAYEELPLAKNIIYSTSGKGKKAVTTATNADPGEDNGFLTSLAIPVSNHLTVTGFYSRSLRDHTDIAGFAFTLIGRAAHNTQ
jgi:hypothetical protein